MEEEITIEELKRRFPGWEIESPEQERKALEFYKKARLAIKMFAR